MIVLLIFASVLFIRLYLSLSSTEFATDNSYYVIRQVEHIKDTGMPIVEDDLSNAGRRYYGPFTFYYILALFSLFMPTILASKLVLGIISSTTVFFVYLIGVRITKHEEAALLTSIMSGFIPIFLSKTIFSISIYSLVVPLFLALFYCFLRIIDRKSNEDISSYKFYTVALVMFFSFVSVSSILFVLFLIFYLILIRIEDIKLKKDEIEISLFSIFFILWSCLIYLKDILLKEGFMTIFSSIPQLLRSEFFSEFSFINIIYILGIVPVLYGIYGLFRFSSGEQKRYVFMFSSSVYLFLFLLWIRVIEFSVGLMFLGVFLIIMLILHYDWFFTFFDKRKHIKLFPLFKALFILYFLGSFALSSFFPSYSNFLKEQEKLPSELDVSFLKMLSNVSNDSIIIAPPFEGQKIAYYANKKTIFDEVYFGSDVQMRLVDLNKTYTTNSLSSAVYLFDKYSATHILVSERSSKFYGNFTLANLHPDCFNVELNYGNNYLYRIDCRLISYDS